MWQLAYLIFIHPFQSKEAVNLRFTPAQSAGQGRCQFFHTQILGHVGYHVDTVRPICIDDTADQAQQGEYP